MTRRVPPDKYVLGFEDLFSYVRNTSATLPIHSGVYLYALGDWASPREVGRFPVPTRNYFRPASTSKSNPANTVENQSTSNYIYGRHEFAYRWRTAFSRRSSVLDPSLRFDERRCMNLGPSFLPSCRPRHLCAAATHRLGFGWSSLRNRVAQTCYARDQGSQRFARRPSFGSSGHAPAEIRIRCL